MERQDTVKLLRECDAGIKMGVSSIDEVLDCISSEELKQTLIESKKDHERLGSELQEQLDRYGDDGKSPDPMAKSMSWIKTNVKLAVNKSDATVADLMTDGCNMGVKSLNRYLNQYENADYEAKDLTRRLSDTEETLAKNIRQYL